MSKVGVGLLLTAALVLTPLWAAAAEFKVGVVDGMDVVSKSAAGKAGPGLHQAQIRGTGQAVCPEAPGTGQAGGGFPEAGIRDERRCPQDQGGRSWKRRCRIFKSRAPTPKSNCSNIQEQQLAPLFQKLEGAVKAVATGREAGYGSGQAQCRAALHGPQAGHHRQGARQIRQLRLHDTHPGRTGGLAGRGTPRARRSFH